MSQQFYYRSILLLGLFSLCCHASPIGSMSQYREPVSTTAGDQNPLEFYSALDESAMAADKNNVDDAVKFLCAVYFDCTDPDQYTVHDQDGKHKRLSSSLFHGIPKFGKRAFSSAFAGIPKFG